MAYSIYIEEESIFFHFSLSNNMTLARVEFLKWMIVPYWVTHRSQSVYFGRNFPLTKSGIELEFTLYAYAMREVILNRVQFTYFTCNYYTCYVEVKTYCKLI